MAYPQQSVGLYFAEGIPGRRANHNPVVYTSFNKLAGEGGVKLASFVWYDEATDTWLNNGTGEPDGFVETLYDYFIYDIFDDSKFVANAGERVHVMKRVDAVYAVAASGTQTLGQTVFANTSDGTFTTAAAGATVAGHVETTFKVQRVSDVDSRLIVIGNFDKTVPAAAPTAP